jgi:hypothetical protein
LIPLNDRRQWFVEADGMKPEYVAACCAFEAKTQQERSIYAFLCGSGLRISEAQAMRVNGNDEEQTSWNPLTATVSVRNGCFRGKETGRVKTTAGRRNVVLCSELNQALAAFASKEK